MIVRRYRDDTALYCPKKPLALETFALRGQRWGSAPVPGGLCPAPAEAPPPSPAGLCPAPAGALPPSPLLFNVKSSKSKSR